MALSDYTNYQNKLKEYENQIAQKNYEAMMNNSLAAAYAQLSQTPTTTTNVPNSLASYSFGDYEDIYDKLGNNYQVEEKKPQADPATVEALKGLL